MTRPFAIRLRHRTAVDAVFEEARLWGWAVHVSFEVMASCTERGRPELANSQSVCYNVVRSGRGAAWLARYNGVVEVPGSNPGAPTYQRSRPKDGSFWFLEEPCRSS